MVESRRGMLLGVFVLADFVIVASLVMMLRGGVVMSGRLLMSVTRGVFR
jgi:hypothetical protein